MSYKSLNIALGLVFLFILVLFLSSPYCSGPEEKVKEENEIETSYVVVGKYTISYDRSFFLNHPPTFESTKLVDILNSPGIIGASWVDRKTTGEEYYRLKENGKPFKEVKLR